MFNLFFIYFCKQNSYRNLFQYNTIPNSYLLSFLSNKIYYSALCKLLWCMGKQGRNTVTSNFLGSVSCTCAIFCFPTLCIFTYIHYGGCNDICGSDFIIRGFVYLKSILNYSLSNIPDIALRYYRFR